MYSMKNWSGYLKWTPSNVYLPNTEEEIKQVVLKALNEKKKVRIIGSGHSFTPLSLTDDFLISLDNYQGIIHIDKEKLTATVKAGTKLHLLNELLFEQGLAMPNMGDINQQSIAGAISTGTHGTGTAFGNISTQISKIKFANGKGEIVSCSETDKPELFKAAQVSLGSFGIITEITLKCVPTYKLELVIKKAKLDTVLQTYQELNEQYRNFEFYWFPNTPYVMLKLVNLTDDVPDKSTFSNYVQEMLLENYTFKIACEVSKMFPSLTRKISGIAADTIGKHRKVNHSHKVFITPRLVRFNEMEYNIPVEAYKEVKRDIVNWINKNNTTVLFPLENRFVQGDDIYLSPAYKRDSAYIAAHVYNKKEPTKYFKALEEIFSAYNGRPHWGKMNTLTYELAQKKYPMFDTFTKLRAEQDPDQTFLSDYLKTLFIG